MLIKKVLICAHTYVKKGWGPWVAHVIATGFVKSVLERDRPIRGGQWWGQAGTDRWGAGGLRLTESSSAATRLYWSRKRRSWLLVSASAQLSWTTPVQQAYYSYTSNAIMCYDSHLYANYSWVNCRLYSSSEARKAWKSPCTYFINQTAALLLLLNTMR